ncbi:tetratricopeptide repeat protein [Bradyrhizobium diazoefficiens]|nr:tetratricopeptide repeat protein [Bradyrhizobium diazoefficiens]MBR0777503.1 tetratricopeptide repeat protein [Bradyrhizobium diazoefficiens]
MKVVLRGLALAAPLLVVLVPLASPAAAGDTATCMTASGDVAIAACTRAINSGAGQPWINYNNRGFAWHNKGDDDRALADYNQAIRLNPAYGPPHDNRGNIYLVRGDPDRALAEYNEAIRLDPKSAWPYANRANVLRNTGDNDRAIADFNEAIRLNPKMAFAFNGRGLAWYNKGDDDRALADYNQAIRLDPKYGTPHNNRGLIYLARGDRDGAVAEYNEAMRLDPKNEWPYLNRGNVYRDSGDNDRAIADYNEAIRLRPNFAIAFTSRGWAYGNKGDNDRAMADYNEATRLDPKYPWPYVNRGLLHEKAGDTARARSSFEAALKLLPPDGRGWQKQLLKTAQDHLAALPSPPSAVAAAPSQAQTTVVVTAPSIAAALPVPGERRVALVIGNSAYENAPALLNPERDARLVAGVLNRIGFTSVTLLTNLRKDALVGALRDFAALAEKADWAAIYYAGHGMEVGGINYLVPVDAKIGADRDIGFEAVPLDQVLNAAERASRLRLVILDACRDNPFKMKMKRTLTVASRSVSGGLAAIEPAAGTMVVYAAKDGQQASDGDGANSPFAMAFAKNVQTPGLEVRRLFDYVRDDVMEMTRNEQQPFSYGSISGRRDFYFVAAK